MTRYEFYALCEEATVPVELALENDDVRAALSARNSEEVVRLLREEF